MQCVKQVAAVSWRIAAGLAMVVSILAALPGVVLALSSHDPWLLNEARLYGSGNAYGKCEACHTLDAGDPQTSAITTSIRTLASVKLAATQILGRSLVKADNLGCTFCHSNQSDNVTMGSALGDFEIPTIKHPVGRKLKSAGGANSSNEFLSSFGSTVPSDELQCNDCHMASVLGYPYHEGGSTDPVGMTGSWDKVGNPFALQNVTVIADKNQKHCLATCHSDSPAGGPNNAVRLKMGHYAWGHYNNTANIIYEPNGKAMAQQACTTCHDTHTSTIADLTQDGLKRGDPDIDAITHVQKPAIDNNLCVGICHVITSNFQNYGHGRAGFDPVECTPCHNSSISHRDTTQARKTRRLMGTYPDAAMSNLTTNLATDGIDNDMNGIVDDETSFAYSKSSVCKGCHIKYAGHGTGGRVSACLDCHDIHGEDAAKNSNVAMIRSTIFGENTVFTATDRDNKVYYKAGQVFGVCDNDACHANIAGSLATTHKGGTTTALTQPCSDCHTISHKLSPDTDNSFKTSGTGCSGCHGGGTTGTPATVTNYWPDGSSGAAANTSPSRHLKHIEDLAARVFGETTTQLLTDNSATTLGGTLLSMNKQKRLCAYCHEDPLGSNFEGPTQTLHNNSATNVTGYIHPIWQAYSADFSTTGGVQDADAAYNSTSDTCATVNCHNNKLTLQGSYGWYDTATYSCLICHTPGGTTNDPTSGLHSSALYSGKTNPTVSGMAHDDSFGSTGTGTCTTCHTLIPNRNATSLHVNGTMAPNNATVDAVEEYYTFATYSDAATNSGTCSGAGAGATNCHDGVGDAGTWKRQWTTDSYLSTTSVILAASECNGCHGSWASGWNTGTSPDHNLPNLASTGKHAECKMCHDYPDASYGTLAPYGSGNHGDGSITMNSAATVNYNTTNNWCTGGVCHPADSSHDMPGDSGWPVELTVGPGTACNNCHGGGTTGAPPTVKNYWPDGSTGAGVAENWPAQNRHLKHIEDLASRVFGETTTQLLTDNSATTLGGTLLSDVKQKRLCAYCHEDPLGSNFTGPTLTLHGNNTTNVNGYVHPIWQAYSKDFTTTGGNMDANAVYNTTNDTCLTVDCHNNKLTIDGSYGWYDAAPNACIMCHTPGGTTNDPTSGLHNSALYNGKTNPTVTGMAHDDSFGSGAGTGTCTTCHTLMPNRTSTSLHENGTWSPNNATVDAVEEYYTFSAYSDAAQKLGTCFGGAIGATNCHDGAGDAGTWKRQWTTESYLSTTSVTLAASECNGCHGSWASGWNTGTSPDHNLAGLSATANHAECKMCHNYPDASYGTLAPYGSANHGDGSITMNSAATVNFNTTNNWCTGGVCHPADSSHDMPGDSGWPVELIAGPSASCNNCHGGGTTGAPPTVKNYWPDGTHAANPEDIPAQNRHLKHIEDLAARVFGETTTQLLTDNSATPLGGTLLSDVKQKRLCAYCHEDPLGSNFTGPTLTLHGNNSTNVNGYIHPLWQAYSADFGTTGGAQDADAYFNASVDTCATMNCHNNKLTLDGSYGWYDSAPNNCMMCHTPGGATNDPTSGLHNSSLFNGKTNPTVSGMAHDNSFGAGASTGTCTTCHTLLPARSATSLHENGTLNPNNATIDAAEEYYTFSAYSDAAQTQGTCSGGAVGATNCHDGIGDAGTWKRQWTTDSYLSTTSVTLAASECNGCHGSWASGWNTGTSPDHNLTGLSTTGNHTECKMCHDYPDASYGTLAPFGTTNHGDGSITMNSVASVNYNTTNNWCMGGVCHPADASHDMPGDSGWPVELTAGPAAACTNCHGGGTTVGTVKNYWPDGTHAANPEDIPAQNRHLKHIEDLASRVFGETTTQLLTDNSATTLGGTLLSDLKQKRLCAYCHEDPLGSNFTGPTLTLHGNNSTNVNGYIHPIWQAYSKDFTTTGGNMDADAYFNASIDTCATVNCHNNKLTLDGSYGWYDTAPNACMMCHTPGGATNDPTSGLHNSSLFNGKTNPTVTGMAHDNSFGAGPGTGTCTTCHTLLPARSATSLHENGTLNPNNATVDAAEEYYTFSAYSDAAQTQGTCSGGAIGATNCHDGVGDAGTWKRQWTTDSYLSTTSVILAASECQGCHGSWAGGWNTGTSPDHNLPGLSSTGNHAQCQMCHLYADASYGALAPYGTGNHGDGSITMNSAATVNYNTTNNWCMGGVCHPADASHDMPGDSGWPVELTAGPAISCSSCHGGGTSGTTVKNYWPDGTHAANPEDNPAQNRHLKHIEDLAARVFGETTTQLMTDNSATTLGGTLLSDVKQKRVCAYCHEDPLGSNFTGPTLTLHNNNTTNLNGYIHPIWQAYSKDFTTTGGNMDANAVYNTTNDTCLTVDCHNNKLTLDGSYGWYDTAPNACIMCHTPGGTTNDPTSGLHNSALYSGKTNPTVSGMAHDDSFGSTGTATCTTCHTLLPVRSATSLHENGTLTLNNTTVDAAEEYYTFSAYSDAAQNSGSCFGAAAGAANCHDGAGDAGTWKRQWTTDSYLSTTSLTLAASECGGCHGTWATGWNTGTSPDHNLPGLSTTGNHAECKQCHDYPDASYGALAPWASGNHGDGSLTMNSNSSVNYNTTNNWCTGGVCHPADSSHDMPGDSGWGIELTVGPGTSCSTCHGGGTAGTTVFNYWPDGTHAANPEDNPAQNRHLKHIEDLAARVFGETTTQLMTDNSATTLGGTLLSDIKQKRVCAYCHEDPLGSNFTGPGLNLHNNNTTNLYGYIHPIWQAYSANFSTTGGNMDANATYNTTNDTCWTVDCHNNKLTVDGSYGWYDTAPNACIMCHTPGGTTNDPTSGLHKNSPVPTISGMAHDDSFGSTGTATCTTCHTLLPVRSATSLHENGTLNPNNTTVDAAEEYYTFSAYSDAAQNSGSCFGAAAGAANCHDGAGDAGTWKRQWTTDSYLSTTSVTLAASECGGCHGTWATGWNTGTSPDHNLPGLSATGNHSECKMCHDYPDASYGALAPWASGNHGDGSITMNSVASVNYNTTNNWCLGGVCHPADSSHDMPGDSGWGIELTVGPGTSCTSCHGGGTSGTTVKNYWPDGTHAANPEDIPAQNRHLKHIEDLAARVFGETTTQLLIDNSATTLGGTLLSDVKQKRVCAYCHEDPLGSNFTGPGLNLHNNNTTNLYGYIHPIWQAYSANFSTTGGNMDADAVYNTTNDTCWTVNCHNNKTTLDGSYGWYDTAPNACIMCHTPGGATNDPTSGLHDNTPVPTISGVAHDDSFGTGPGTGTCTTCHTLLPTRSATSLHENGTLTPNNTTVDAVEEYYTFATYSDNVQKSGVCFGAAAGQANCHDGVGDAGTWKRQWTTDAYLSTNSVTLAASECNGCHGTWASGWNTGTIPDHNLTDLAATGNHGECKMCHNYPDASYGTFAPYGGANHGDGSITMNSNTSVNFNTTNNWCLGGLCHAADTSHQMVGDSGWPVELTTGPAASCSACHNNGTGPAPQVNSASPHTDYNGASAGGGGNDGCTDCHSAHASGSAAASNNIEIKTRQATAYTVQVPTMTGTYGRMYSTHSYAIRLGGAATLAYAQSTEAEICWACHKAQDAQMSNSMAEFGVNNNTSTGGMTYNYGSLDTWGTQNGSWWATRPATTAATWRTATRTNPNFSYKDAALQSMHAANYAATVPGTDNVELIHCSYCHDVHDTGGAPTGQPYLRGTWMGNPYKEDGAPQSGQTFAAIGSWGAVPRGSTGGSAPTGVLGGYWIDQNSTTPRSTWAYTNTTGDGASLCSICHGTNINALNQFGSPSTDWVSTFNGHGNAVRGATAPGNTETALRNIFNTRGGVTANGGNPLMHYQGATNPGESTSSGFRGGNGLSYLPYMTSCPTRYSANEWGADSTGATYNVGFHKFPCSKCHVPHASRLPRLMITNCLDTKHNTWDDTYQQNTSLTTTSGTLNSSRSISNWTAAVNCHRRGFGGPASGVSTTLPASGAGWNLVTPW